MLLCALSDTHRGILPQIKPCDILILAGDILDVGRAQGSSLIDIYSSTDDLISWLKNQPATYKIYVPGNHDGAVSENRISMLRLLKPHCITLIGQELIINSIKIYGFPWTPKIGNWSWMYKRNSSSMKWAIDRIPNDTELLISHGPAKGILDNTYGCELLAEKINHMPKLRVHVFGHIHEQHGSRQVGNIAFYNVSIYNHISDTLNEPTYFTL